MHPELPVCRCCFCLPLRYDLIAWGYLKLAFSSLLVTLFIFLINWTVSAYNNHNYMSPEKDWTDLLQLLLAPSISLCITFIDVILCIIFIVGCYKKKVRLIKPYYVFSIVVLILMTIISIYSTCSSIFFALKYTYYKAHTVTIKIMEAMPLLAYIGLEAYIILLIRSELNKLNNGCQFRFVNNAIEAQCTLTVKDTQIEERNTNK